MRRLHSIIPNNHSSDFLTLEELKVKHDKRDKMKAALRQVASEKDLDEIKEEMVENKLSDNYVVCTAKELDQVKKSMVDMYKASGKTVVSEKMKNGRYKLWAT